MNSSKTWRTSDRKCCSWDLPTLLSNSQCSRRMRWFDICKVKLLLARPGQPRSSLQILIQMHSWLNISFPTKNWNPNWTSSCSEMMNLKNSAKISKAWKCHQNKLKQGARIAIKIKRLNGRIRRSTGSKSNWMEWMRKIRDLGTRPGKSSWHSWEVEQNFQRKLWKANQTPFSFKMMKQ